MESEVLTTELIVELIDEDYLRVRGEEGSHGLNPIRGSGLGDCPRSIISRLTMPELDKEARFGGRQLRIFEAGHQRERALIERLVLGLTARNPHWVAEQQVPVSFPISSIEPGKASKTIYSMLEERYPSQKQVVVNEDGYLCIQTTCDLVLCNPHANPNLLYNIDTKTKNGYGFRKLGDEGNGYGYRLQLAAQNRGLTRDGKTVAGCWALYESKDTCDLLPISLEGDADAELTRALMSFHQLLDVWRDGMSTEVVHAKYADPVHWNKPSHVAAAGCLPWQCNYCAVGPVKGNCLPGRTLKDIRSKGKDIPRWEVS